MTARVPDGEQPVGGEGLYGYLASLRPIHPSKVPSRPRPRPAEPTVDGLAELKALIRRAETAEVALSVSQRTVAALEAKVARVEALIPRIQELAEFEQEADRDAVPLLLVRDRLRRALEGDGG